ncbi:MAG: hypothetical protein AAF734_11035 [Bacteroidota bacterium]
MKLSFNTQGYLQPAGINSVTLDIFEEMFVNSFGEESVRKKLYQKFLTYNQALGVIFEGQDYTQWIDGSFVSLKTRPRDIDLVNLIDYQLVYKYE